MEAKFGRSTCILADIQGPKLRLGTFRDGAVEVEPGDIITLVLDEIEGGKERVTLAAPGDFTPPCRSADAFWLMTARSGCGSSRFAMARQTAGSRPGASCRTARASTSPMQSCRCPPSRKKTVQTLKFALDLGVDWVALSFVQQPSDVIEARRIVGDRAQLMVKMEKPSAIHHLDELVMLADGMMVDTR